MAFCRAMLEVEIRMGRKGDGAVQQGVQHQVTQGRLLGALCHPLGREQVLKNVIDQLVGFVPVIIGVHPSDSP